jgi:hypothetical protein
MQGNLQPFKVKIQILKTYFFEGHIAFLNSDSESGSGSLWIQIQSGSGSHQWLLFVCLFVLLLLFSRTSCRVDNSTQGTMSQSTIFVSFSLARCA